MINKYAYIIILITNILIKKNMKNKTKKRTDITGSDRKTFKEGTLIRGYFLASMGRSVLHGHDQVNYNLSL